MGFLQVVYEDGHMACVVKPAGMPTAQVSNLRKTCCNLTFGAQSACSTAVTTSICKLQCKLLLLMHTGIVQLVTVVLILQLTYPGTKKKSLRLGM